VAADTLSPSVRRLVRHFSLDVAQIHGTGPEGRIRVGDVMAVLGGRASPTPDEASLPEPPAPVAPRSVDRTPVEAPMTSVFECDLSAVLADRKRLLDEKHELSLTSYFLAACLAAIEAVPESARPGPIDLGAAMPDARGDTLVSVVRNAAELRLLDIDEALKAALRDVRRGERSRTGDDASFVLYHHGLSGSLLATPTPLRTGHAVSVGIGKIKRQVAIQDVAGQAAPRVLPLCYVSMTFRPECLDLHRANRFLAHLVGRLERWIMEAPEERPARPSG
jgi:pyruvate/2-oxoglutarate dehydrogenase complex dihydrolipoamide acyltransferase (E2) component